MITQIMYIIKKIGNLKKHALSTWMEYCWGLSILLYGHLWIFINIAYLIVYANMTMTYKFQFGGTPLSVT